MLPCNGNAKSWPEAVIEHLVGRQGHPRGAQVQAMLLSDWKGSSQDPPLPRPHLRVGSGGKSISSLRSLPYLRPSKGKQLFSLCFFICVCSFWARSHFLKPKTLPPCCYHPITVLHALFLRAWGRRGERSWGRMRMGRKGF